MVKNIPLSKSFLFSSLKPSSSRRIEHLQPSSKVQVHNCSSEKIIFLIDPHLLLLKPWNCVHAFGIKNSYLKLESFNWQKNY